MTGGPTANPVLARALLAAAFGALAVVLAFPTADLVFPIWVAWTPLLVVARRLGSWRGRLVAGWALGFGYNAVLFWFIVPTLREMSGLPDAVGAGAVVLYALWHGLMSGAFLALAEPVRRAVASRGAGLAAVAVAVLFTAVEWVWPVLGPWSLGHAVAQTAPLGAMQALTGAPGLTLTVMLVAAGLAEAWEARSVRPLGPGLAVAGVLVLSAAAWSQAVQRTDVRRTLRVALVQMNYTLDEKGHLTTEVQRGLMDRFEAALRALEPDRYDLIVASEGAFPGLWQADIDTVSEEQLAQTRGGPLDAETLLAFADTRRVQRAIAEGPRTPAIIGGLRDHGEPERTRNSAVLVGADGRIGGVYDKNILMPLSEYMPGSSAFPALANSVPGITDFGAGETPCRFEVAGERVTCGICYETQFAGFTREAAGDASVIINLTIDTWFGPSTAPWLHLRMHASRAAELGIPMIRGSLSGVSAFIDATGQITAVLPLDVEGVLVEDVELRDITTPYRALGPVFAWLVTLIAAGLLGMARRHRLRLP